MKTLCIINPVAGRGRAIRVWEQVKHKLAESCSTLAWEFSQGQGDATAIARGAVSQGYELVVVFGGDGTLHEVVNGLAGSAASLAVIPAGTGNDFARSLGISKDPQQAMQVLTGGKMKYLDLGRFDGRYFLNMAGLGFDADVAHRINGKRLLKGQLAYLIAVLQTLAAYDSYQLEIIIDGQSFTEEAIMVSVGNGQFVGGGFRLLPQASMEDGFLDVMVVKRTSRADIIRTLPSLYRGTHLEHPKCSFYRGREVTISLIQPSRQVFAQVDGQEISQFPLSFRVLHRALQVIAP